MYQRLDDIACIGNVIGSIILDFIKVEKVRPVHELKILSYRALMYPCVCCLAVKSELCIQSTALHLFRKEDFHLFLCTS